MILRLPPVVLRDSYSASRVLGVPQEAIIAGNTASPDFPVTETVSKVSPVQFSSGFVAKLSADGSKPIYSSILGASKGLTINALAIDATGAPYVAGNTPSPDFPTTTNVPQPALPRLRASCHWQCPYR